MTTLLLIDDHPLVQVALEAALLHAPFPLNLLSAENQHDALGLLSQKSIDVVILDISLPDSDGLQLLKRIKRLYPELPVVIYSAQEERVWPRLAEAAGAAGYVAKRQPLNQLLSAVLAVLGGQRAFPPRQPDEMPADPLTAKELQILALLARGQSNLQIADQLNISNKTVSTHKKNIMEKTGAQSVVELAQLWQSRQ
ncbi:response regulator transcription factor [Erwinia sp. Eh17-17]|jgi:two-component system response regulator FimZ (fimbrial Z protein)/two-component system response regulator EvgA|uniref:response regulator transcription factor n=1 Tax=Erwinia sp. Eh17-17 TaxID=3080330 RepID=UPI003207EB57